MTNSSKNIPSAEDYVDRTQLEAALETPEIYIDSIDRYDREEFLLVDGKIIKRIVDVPIGLVRIFVELLTNAADAVSSTARKGGVPGIIRVEMNETCISVYNESFPIPVEMKHSKVLNKKVYVPTLTFGTFYVSSNYTEEKHEAGKFGVGAKMANVFSNRFVVEVQDNHRGKHFKQVWYNNMSETDEPEITEMKDDCSWVYVEMAPDLLRFGYKDGVFPEDFYSIVARWCVDVSFTTKVIVEFNGFTYNYKSIEDYGRLYFGYESKVITHYVWPEDVKVKKINANYQESKSGFHKPRIEMAAFDTPNNGNVISFVNSLLTPEGGVHADTALKAVAGHIVEKLNKEIIKMVKAADSDSKGSIPKLTLRDIRPHLSIVVSVRVVNPSFNSNSKTILRGPAKDVAFSLPASKLKDVKTWDLVSYLKKSVDVKTHKVLVKTNGKKMRYVNVHKAKDANNAGHRTKSKDCTLIITEGDSADSYASVLVGLFKNGRDTYGTFPIRGKLRNAIKSDNLQISKSKEIAGLVSILGLKYDLDYTSDKNYNTLRYGTLMLLMDPDVDGQHIRGLVLAYFEKYFPSLLERGFVVDNLTPYLRVNNGLKGRNKKKLRFYFEEEFENWKNSTPGYEKWKFKYFKGMGSSEKKDVIDDKENSKIIKIVYDQEASKYIHLAFDSDYTNERKRWIKRYNKSAPRPILENHETVKSFVNNRLVIYSAASVIRHISGIDGLNPVKRKILHATFKLKEWGRKKGSMPSRKVGNFNGYVQSFTNYHHGDLVNVIVGMAQEFVGSNNLNYFKPKGMLGTRLKGGKDAAKPRYTFVKPEWWLPYVFKEEDDDLLEYIIDEGMKIEPKFYLPIMPMSLVNGVVAIATGHSSFIPQFNPLDIIDWLMRRLDNKETIKLVPWYRGFKGKITIIDKRNNSNCNNNNAKDVIDADELTILDLPGCSADNSDNNKNKEDDEISIFTANKKIRKIKYRMITTGNFSINKKGDTITITELPIGIWTDNYEKWLYKMRELGIIKDFRMGGDEEKVHIEIKDMDFKNNSIKAYEEFDDFVIVTDKMLKLERAYGMTNMVLLDENYQPKSYNSPEDILEDYYNFRLPYYEERRLLIIEKLTRDINEKMSKRKFIIAYLEGRIVLRHNNKARKEEDIVRELKEMDIDPKHLSKSFRSVTDKSVKKLTEQIEKLEKELEIYNNYTNKDIWKLDLLEFKDKYINYY